MKTHFDWQTEESEGQRKAEVIDRGPPPGPKFGFLALTLLVATIAISFLVWLLSDTQSEAVASVRENVLLVYELQQRAIEEGDEELFSTLLSSNAPAWKRGQEELFAANLFQDRSVFGLIGHSALPDQTALDLSPDLQKAQLSFMQDYTVLKSPEDDPELKLLHHLVFRLEDGRWKLSPPDLSFWGPWNEVEGEYVTITFPERDAALAQPLVDLIDGHLKGVCAEVDKENQFGEAFCTGNMSWHIRLSADERALLDYAKNASARTGDFDYELPAPTLVGVPVNEKDLDIYFELYTKSILQKMETALLTTAPFPDQQIFALCFDHPASGRNLYRYDWRLRSWRSVLPTQTFQYLSALPDDSAIMLAEGDTITLIHGNEDASSDDHRTVWQGVVPTLFLKILLGWIDTGKAPYFLLMDLPSGMGLPHYSLLDIQACERLGCLPGELPGFPVASATSDASLFVVGSNILLSTGSGEDAQPIGSGFSPFWIDGETYGFVRFQGDIESGITTQVVLGDLAGSELRVLVDGNELYASAAIPGDDVLYIHEVIPNPVDTERLHILSTGVRDYSGNYFIFSLDLSERQIEETKSGLKLEAARRGSLTGVPGLLSPTGFPSVLASNNGRWLAMMELNSHERETWTILVHDLLTGITSEVGKDVPAVPGNFPLIDWSGDGQWLMIADRDFLHLIAPEYGYEELIAHDFDACSHIVWAD